MIGLEFYHCATTLHCLNGISLPEVLFLNRQNGVEKTLNKINFNGDIGACYITCRSKVIEDDVVFVFDTKSCLCISFSSSPKNIGSKSFKRLVQNTYDEASFGVVPVKHHEVVESDNERIKNTIDINTSHVDFLPISMSIFDNPAFEDGTTRRYSIWVISALSLFTCLLVAFSIYRLTFKRTRSLDNAGKQLA